MVGISRSSELPSLFSLYGVGLSCFLIVTLVVCCFFYLLWWSALARRCTQPQSEAKLLHTSGSTLLGRSHLTFVPSFSRVFWAFSFKNRKDVQAATPCNGGGGATPLPIVLLSYPVSCRTRWKITLSSKINGTER